MSILRAIFDRTLNSVIFGIILMVLVAAYVAIGSGVVSVREAFEMNEMQFFNAWPLKLLMGLLVVTLATVTWTRIPFTPPRYGVWLIHAGIITLVVGTSLHYKLKLEGTVRLFQGRPLGYFYDAGERAIFAAVDGKMTESGPLPSLPRFKGYAAEFDNTAALDRLDLKGVSPIFASRDAQSGRPVRRSLSEELGLKDPVSLEIVGYYPYAQITTQFLEDPASKDVGVTLSVENPAGGEPLRRWLVSGESDARRASLAGIEFEHLHMGTADEVAMFQAAAGRFFKLDVNVGLLKQTLFVEPGKSYPIEGAGYTLRVESFNPAFPLSTTGEPVPVLTLLVESGAPAPVQKYRRMVISGNRLQTDFKLDEPGAGPMGKRQQEPLDKSLVLDFTFKDTLRILPQAGSERHLLLTHGGDESVTEIVTFTGKPTESRKLPNGVGEIKITLGSMEGHSENDGHDHSHSHVALTVERKAHVRRNEFVAEVPKVKRDRNEGAAGVHQVAIVRVRSGGWTGDVFVPFSQYVYDQAWRGATIQIPGAKSSLRLQLGQTVRPMPATLTLQKFDLVPYAGGAKALGSVMRDFRSTLVVEDRDTGEKSVGIAAMNQPVYFTAGPWWRSMSWLFFQAGWDPEGQQFTVIGVGNRPGVFLMTAGCAMIFVGLMYAFYLKPVIVRRMRERAIEEARNKKGACEPVMAQ